MTNPFRKPGPLKAYSFIWLMLALFVVSWLAQFGFQVVEVTNEAATHGSAFSWSEFWPQFFASTFENWQSEFLQLFCQVAFLGAVLRLHAWGSSQSPEGDERLEQKIDTLLERTGGKID